MAEQQELKLDGANSGKKTKLIIIIAGVVVFLALVGGGLAFFLGGSSEEEAVATQALPKPGQAMPGAKVVHYIKFDQPFVVSLNTRPRERMLQVYVAVVVSDEQNISLAQINSLLIKSVLNETFTSIDPNLYNDKDGRAQVKKICLENVQNAMRDETGSAVIDQVLFTNFVMQ